MSSFPSEFQFSTVTSQVRLLLTFMSTYTATEYPLTKLDVVVLPLDTRILDLLNSNSAQLGMLYLPGLSDSAINSDKLTQNSALLKLTHCLGKQLAKHFFWLHPHCHEYTDIASETSYFLKSSINDDK